MGQFFNKKLPDLVIPGGVDSSNAIEVSKVCSDCHLVTIYAPISFQGGVGLGIQVSPDGIDWHELREFLGVNPITPPDVTEAKVYPEFRAVFFYRLHFFTTPPGLLVTFKQDGHWES